MENYSLLGKDNQPGPSLEEKLRLEHQFKGGAGWFFWIAGLSLITSIISLAGSSWGFIVGLGVTLVIDAVASQTGTMGKLFAFGLDVIAACVFVLFGILARNRYRWSTCAATCSIGAGGHWATMADRRRRALNISRASRRN